MSDFKPRLAKGWKVNGAYIEREGDGVWLIPSGAQVRLGGGFEESVSEGTPSFNERLYRLPWPGDGYRFLKAGDAWEEGDEKFVGFWEEINGAGTVVESYHVPGRRKIAVPSEVEDDPVNRPFHYTSHPSGVECITITQHHNFCIGNAMKYLWRQGLKRGSPAVQDLRKAVWYIEQEIRRLEGEPSPAPCEREAQ